MIENIVEELREMADPGYRAFHGKLIPGVNTEFLGVRVPQLRKLANRIIREDWRKFLQECKGSNIYEIHMLYGMVTARAKCEFSEKQSYLEKFVPQIDNWAVCDIVCGELKDIKKYPEQVYAFIQKYLESDKEYEVRFGVVVLMQYFLNDEYIDKVLDWYAKINHPGYYVKMAVAWAISVCYVKYPEKTMILLKNEQLNEEIYKKAIQKIRESKRVTSQEKEILKIMKKQKFEKI